jgi:enolase
MSKIDRIQAIEIMDSRGNPTVSARVILEDGSVGEANVPSGASTGVNEALELRDEDAARYDGKGVLTAVSNVNGLIADGVRGMDVANVAGLRSVDEKMFELDGTENKAKLGANAVLAVSLATAKAAAISAGLPLWRFLKPEADEILIPVPMMNIMNGGAHADGGVDMQEFMVMPTGAPSFAEAIRYGSTIQAALKGLLKEAGHPTTVGDEGGFAPKLTSNEAPLKLIRQAIAVAAAKEGFDPAAVKIALDPATSEMCKDGEDGAEGIYEFHRSGEPSRSTAEMVDLWEDWLDRYPEIVSVEDGLDESDWAGWQELTKRVGGRVQLVGDDLLVTNTKFIERGIREASANSVLIKVNQIGSLSETIDAVAMAHDAGWRAVMSHRSGETEDATIADLAVALSTGQLKTGAGRRSDRVAKYNRLLWIEKEAEELGVRIRFENPFA